MATVTQAKWQDQARTILIATINRREWSGIHSKSRLWSKVISSGVPIADPDPVVVVVPEAGIGDIWETLKAQLPQLNDSQLPSHVDPPRPTPGGP